MWEFAYVMSLLNNCGVWTKMSKATEEVLEELQYSFVRSMLHVPVSTPKVSLLSETGLLSMKHRVWSEKLRMTIVLQKLEEKVMAKKIYLEQKRQGWRGLVSETGAIFKGWKYQISISRLYQVEQSRRLSRNIERRI